MKNLLITLTILIGCYYVTAVNYCDRSLCPNGGPHIACNNNGGFSSNCPSDTTVFDLSKLKTTILRQHNKLRNRIASGKLRPFNSAAKMATMQWDTELAKLATLNVKRCKMEHDKCRNTKQFKYSGQNLAWWAGTPDSEITQRVIAAIQSWFGEYKDTDNSVIKRYRSSSGKQYGHFTVMVADKNNRVGCGAAKLKRNGMYEYFIACNYASTNIINQPIYEFGSPTSQCKTGRNPNYQGLCSVNEKYNL